jgi:hypothetical protein
MTTQELLAELQRRGLRVVLREDGELGLRGIKEQVTGTLLRVLGWHKGSIREHLLASAPREWLWRDGHTYREQEGEWKDEWLCGHAERHPVGAWWFRHVGQTTWQPIAARTPAEMSEAAAAA